MEKYIIKDINLAEYGHKKIEWAFSNMPLLTELSKEFSETKPFEGLSIALSIHLEAKTACLVKTLAKGGAKMFVTGSNPLSTQDDIAAALAEEGICVYARHGVDNDEYVEHLNKALDGEPNIIIDDGGDLVGIIHSTRTELIGNIIGGCEETTTGIRRLNAMSRSGELRFPMISVNNADCKHLFDNRYGTGQSVWDGINRTTNLIVAGKVCVVAGYGWCGKGVAMRAKGLGAKVVVCEIDPVKAIEAYMDGFEVMKMSEAASIGDIFITVTGCRDVITKEHFEVMKSGVILANAGHFNVEINVSDLEEISDYSEIRRNSIRGYRLRDGKWINLLAEGRLVNLAAGDGHPVEIMDMSFAIQALSAEYLAYNRNKPVLINSKGKVIDVPKDVDERVAFMKLKSLNIEIDKLSKEQDDYINAALGEV